MRKRHKNVKKNKKKRNNHSIEFHNNFLVFQKRKPFTRTRKVYIWTVRYPDRFPVSISFVKKTMSPVFQPNWTLICFSFHKRFSLFFFIIVVVTYSFVFIIIYFPLKTKIITVAVIVVVAYFSVSISQVFYFISNNTHQPEEEEEE